MTYFIGHDLGTGGNKCVLVDVSGRVLATSTASYPLTHPQPGWAEQDPESWWQAVAACTREVVRSSGVAPESVAGMCMAGQMLALVGVDAKLRPTRPAISWLDARAGEEAQRLVRRLGGRRFVAAVAGAVPSGKDLVAKLAWIRDRQPEVFAATRWFCDATGYLVLRATGLIGIDQTGAAGTGMMDAKSRQWSRLLCSLSRFPLEKMPPIRGCTDVVSPLTAEAAQACGLTPRTQVVMGMGDAPAAAVGSGALEDGDGHVYLGTSGWGAVTSQRARNVARNGIFALASADPRRFLLIGETETAGACLDWLLRMVDGGEPEPYARLDQLATTSGAGARGVLFAPWLFGERAPVPDAQVRAAFVNLSLEHERSDLVRAVYEGVAYNLRWIFDAIAGAGMPCKQLRAIGGGARSDVWLQVIADVCGRRVERVAVPQQAGAVGVALTAAVGLGVLPDLVAIKRTVPVERVFEPQTTARDIYESQYRSFQALYPALAAAARRGPTKL